MNAVLLLVGYIGAFLVNGAKSELDIHSLISGQLHQQSENLQSLEHKRPFRNITIKQRRQLDWEDYYTYDEINNWLQKITKRYPEASLFTVGRSYEGRAINGVKVSFGSRKNAVFFEGGIHAREWITPAVVTYILNEILTSDNKEIQDLARKYDWYFVPTVNPDGYEYTFNVNRLWRRTRSGTGLCKGADANRNWDFHWNEIGTSGPCFDFYPGQSAFSEPEMKALSIFLKNVSKTQNISVYLAIHSPFQQLLLPYAFGERPSNYDDMLEIAKKAAESLKNRHGTEFDVGNWADEMYASSGVSVDWVTGVLGVPFAFTYELRDKVKGFILPAKDIIPVCEETMDSIVTLIQEVNIRGY